MFISFPNRVSIFLNIHIRLCTIILWIRWLGKGKIQQTIALLWCDSLYLLKVGRKFSFINEMSAKNRIIAITLTLFSLHRYNCPSLTLLSLHHYNNPHWRCSHGIDITGPLWRCSHCITITAPHWRCSHCIATPAPHWRCSHCITHLRNQCWILHC